MGRFRSSAWCALGAALVLVAGCGGGGGGAKTETVTLFGASVRDGELQRDLPAGAVSFDSASLRVGDTYAGAAGQLRGILSFDLSPIPPGSQIDEAVLSVYQRAVTGTPYGDLGPLWVDHIVLAGAPAMHWSGALATGSLGVISTVATLGRKTLAVTGAVADDVAAGRSSSDYRLWFRTDNDGDMTDDHVELDETVELDFGGEVPILVVTFTR